MPVELQVRPDLSVNAQPEGEQETVGYARERWREMCLEHGPTTGIDISIESGAIGNLDVAVVILYSHGNEVVVLSRGIAFPPGVLEEARARGFKTTTAGDIIHERFSHIPSNNWHVHFPPYKSREDQIVEAVVSGLDL